MERRCRVAYWLTCLASGPVALGAGVAGWHLASRWWSLPFPHGKEFIAWTMLAAPSFAVADRIAAWVCRRTGVSLELQRVEVLRRQRGETGPADDAGMEVRLSRPVLLLAGCFTGLCAVGGWLRILAYPARLDVWFQAILVTGMALICWRMLGRDANVVLAVDGRGVRRWTPFGVRVIPWEEIARCSVHTERDPAGRTRRTTYEFRDRRGRLLLSVNPLPTLTAQQHSDFAAAVRAHHGLPAREPTELEASPPPEGTGSELEAALAPAGRGTELEAAGAPGCEGQGVSEPVRRAVG